MHPRLIAHLDPSRITHPTVLPSYPTFSRLYPTEVSANGFLQRHQGHFRAHLSHSFSCTLLFSPQKIWLSWIGVGLGFLQPGFDSATRSFSVLKTWRPHTNTGVRGNSCPHALLQHLVSQSVTLAAPHQYWCEGELLPPCAASTLSQSVSHPGGTTVTKSL